MRDYHGLPRIYGTTLIFITIIIFVPLLGFIGDILTQYGNPDISKNWSLVMVIWTIIAIGLTIFIMAIGADIAWYHDKKVDDATLDEKAKDSEFKPTEESD